LLAAHHAGFGGVAAAGTLPPPRPAQHHSMDDVGPLPGVAGSFLRCGSTGSLSHSAGFA
jgi:hypothetical protein